MVFEKSLTAMVKGIRAHRGKESEYINTCVQEIQKELTSRNLATKSMAVLKLSYLNMLGYDMSWATFAVVEVMSHNRLAIKRPGYLASAMSFNENTDVGLLTINLFKKDFQAKSQYETGLAISCLGSICSPDISRDIISDLMGMLNSSRAYLRKKTVLCLYRIMVKDPPALRTSYPKLRDRLGDDDQGVLTATVNTFLELSRKNARNYMSLVPQFYHLLLNTSNNWLTIKLLKLFQLLAPLEPRLPAKLLDPLTNFLNTTKAQSVEFEAIRCTVRTMAEGSAIVSLAIEKLQAFLNSSDRNLRFLALELFREILEKPQFAEKLTIPDLNAKVLQSIEESDTTARKVALQLLNQIVTPKSFQETVQQLMEFSKNSGQPDEFVDTILRMGGRDVYALVEDFPWYLEILAAIARTSDSSHAGQIAEQFTDIIVRVEQVRPFAVHLALSLVDRSSIHSSAGDQDASTASAQEVALDVGTPMVGACAWVIGEFHGCFATAQASAETSFIKAARALLAPKDIRGLEPCIQAQCIWAATKLYLGSPQYAPAVVDELHDMLSTNLPFFIQSTHVDVSERVSLSLQLCSFMKRDIAKLNAGTSLLSQPLRTVKHGAQLAMPKPEGLDLDEPFFPPETLQSVFAPVAADEADPTKFATNYKDDLGFLAANEERTNRSGGSTVDTSTSIFYLGSKDRNKASKADEKASEESRTKAAGTQDAFEQMRESLAGRGMKYQVNRDDLQVPGPRVGSAQVAHTAVAAANQGPAGDNNVSVSPIPMPSEKQLTELQGRLWSQCFRNDHVAIYVCVRSKNTKKNLLRVDLRCERVSCAMENSAPSIADVVLRLPREVAAQEADAAGDVKLVVGELRERSDKVKVKLSLTCFSAPVTCAVDCEVNYSLSEMAPDDSPKKAVSMAMALQLPATAFLAQLETTDDDVAEYLLQHTAELQSSSQTVSLNLPGQDADSVWHNIPHIVGRCAGLCNFFGLQQNQGQGQIETHKFILSSQPLVNRAASFQEQSALPEGSRIICRCVGKAKNEGLELTVSAKSCSKKVCEDVCTQLASVFSELVEGRLRME